MTDEQPKTLLLIDLSSLFWPAWFGTAHLQLSEAFERTVRRVHLHASKGYDYVAVCCDSGPSFRKDIDPEYKANRDEKDQAAIGQLRDVQERLEKDGFLLWRATGFEADDVIATAAHTATTVHGLGVTILSADKDLMQLVSPQVVQISANSGDYYGENEVREKFGVGPRGMRDLLALMGDSSDNIKGVPGVGAKTAAKLLNEFGDIDSLQRALHEPDVKLPPKLKQKLLDNGDALDLARRLVTLRTDAPINFAELYEERKPQPLTDSAGDFGDWDEDDDHGEDADMSDERSDDDVPITTGKERERAPEPTSTPEPKSAPAAAEAPGSTNGSGNGNGAEPQTTALARRDVPWALQLEPTNTRGAYTMATHLHESRLFGSFTNPDAIFAVILTGRTMGLDAVTALRGFHVIEGKPSPSAQLLIGAVLRSGKAEYFELVESTSKGATWETKRRGGRNPVRMSFTVEDAKVAGLTRPSKSGKPSNWDKYPKTMLRWRAATDLARTVYPDVVSNVYTPDELGDPAVIDVEFEQVTE